MARPVLVNLAMGFYVGFYFNRLESYLTSYAEGPQSCRKGIVNEDIFK